MNIRFGMILFFSIVFISSISNPIWSQGTDETKDIDDKVKRFLREHKDEWVDWNVPEADGKALYDLIIENNYQRALEIGTSTGHSAIWIACKI